MYSGGSSAGLLPSRAGGRTRFPVPRAPTRRWRRCPARHDSWTGANELLTDTLDYFNAPRPGGNPVWETHPTRNKKGFVLREPGTEGDANTVRFMGGTEENPDGYMVYYNKIGQPINPETGQPGSKGETHIKPGFKGEIKSPRWWTGK